MSFRHTNDIIIAFGNYQFVKKKSLPVYLFPKTPLLIEDVCRILWYEH